MHRSVKSLAGALDFLTISQSCQHGQLPQLSVDLRPEDSPNDWKIFCWDLGAGTARRAASWAAQCAALARAYVKGRVAGGAAMDFMDRCPSTTPLGPGASSASENSSFETSCYVGV